MSSRAFTGTLAALCWAASLLTAQDVKYRPDGEVFPGPPTPADRAEWIADLQHWRTEKKIRSGYTASEYERKELAWAQRNFVQPQMMVEDRYFYDSATRRYTVDRYLDDLDKRYGGIDSVLIWPVYPNIGIDSRSQYDLIRDLPGGVTGVQSMIADFHRRGVKVFFPVMPWDQGTNDPSVSNAEATAKLFAEIGADGVNGDTFNGIPHSFRAASDATQKPLVLEPENNLEADEMLAWNTQSWGYCKYNFIPVVSRYKWMESRHMVNVCRRWARDHTDDLQHAFFNGVGFESWENIWGIWNGITPRDAEALRRIATIERNFAELLVRPDWEPHVPVIPYGVYASRFPGTGRTLWTLVNRNEYPVTGEQLALAADPGMHYFDLWHGVELKPKMVRDSARLSFDIEGQGFGAVLAAANANPEFLKKMQNMTGRPLASYSREWKALEQTLTPIAATEAAATAPPNMVHIPGNEFEFDVNGIEIEGQHDEGVDVQYPWEPSARRNHIHRMTVKPFFIDKTLVTNADFAKFLQAAQYHPADDHNFLKHWRNGTYPEGAGRQPVIWVSLEDARAYAKWAGKRLPHEWEWQYAAQGVDGRKYPWGNLWKDSAVPAPDHGRTVRAPDNVGSFADGESPFGVRDLVATLWQWTDEYSDEHTRAATLRGGSYYQPHGSHWYFPQAYLVNTHGKYLLMSPGKDRSAGVSFRCVVDADN
jgi:iron(II)-dependent oxidoreductase